MEEVSKEEALGGNTQANISNSEIVEFTAPYLEAVIMTRTPLHVASFEPFNAFNYKGAEYLKKGETIKAQHASRFFAGGGYPKTLACFPANDLRGRMRRAAAERILKQVKTVGLEVFQILTTGSLPGGAQEGRGTIDIPDRVREMNDIYLGSFGGGINLSQSAFSVFDIVPIVPGACNSLRLVPSEVVEKFTVANASGNPSDFPLVTHPYIFTSRDDVLRGSPLVAAHIEDWQNNAASYLDKIIEAQTARKAQKDETKEDKKAREEDDAGAATAKKTDRNMIFGAEAIMPGVPMYVRIELSPSLTQAQIGFVAACLDDVLNTSLGGLSRIGFGRVEVVKPVTIKNHPDELLLENCLEAMEDEIQQYTSESLFECFGLNKLAEKQAKQATKATKKSKAGNDE